MDDDSFIDFNFWPSFADLMLSLVLILLILMFLFVGFKSVGTINLQAVKKNQMSLIESVAGAYRTEEVEIGEDAYGIAIQPDSIEKGIYDIEVRNEPTLQRITFSDRILFAPDDFELAGPGPEVMRQVGEAIKSRLSAIREIQIQGHADTDRTGRFPSNVHLASARAIEVFKFLQEQVGIDPAENLMSATSFGEFKPVQRTQASTKFNEQLLLQENDSPEKKARNRRIELLLFYTIAKE